ncbi:aldo/keto reductase [Campylobacter hyointestinalis]|uniref:aldo/keto reductase n=1 Tax=Campylobacter hyointestinalis TaxID=198 RepID=UPI001CA52FF6|nr:aldo/keto reductase [Campylobacter hyointestinalis]
MQTDHIDMIFVHRIDQTVPIEEVASTVSELMKEGKVLRWGLCEASAKTIRRAHAITPISAIESEYAIW